MQPSRFDIISCPSDVNVDVEIGSSGTRANWTEPYVIDGNVNLISQTHSPGQRFDAGTTTVTYLFMDGSNSIASCVFHIIGSSGEYVIEYVIFYKNNIISPAS